MNKNKTLNNNPIRTIHNKLYMINILNKNINKNILINKINIININKYTYIIL